MSRVCRTNRILELPRDNALLVDVGGSCEMSLVRQSVFIPTPEPLRMQLSSSYGIADFKSELTTLCIMAGLKIISIMFTMIDPQVANDALIVLIDEMMEISDIQELFAAEKIDKLIQTIAQEV